MGTKAKTFDCVEFKRQAQRKLREEFEARRNEFEDYFEFLEAKARESAWVRRMEEKFG